MPHRWTALCLPLACAHAPAASDDDAEAARRERLRARCEQGDAAACAVLKPDERIESRKPQDAAAGKKLRPAAPFTAKVAGLTLGAQPSELIEACVAAGGYANAGRRDGTDVGSWGKGLTPTDSARANEIGDGGTLLCTPPPAQPFARLDLALVRVCGSPARACEINLAFTGASDDDADSVRRILEDKYGPMKQFPNAVARCRLPHVEERTFNGMWVWFDDPALD